MHVTLEETVRGVDPVDALAWWTAFRGGHADHAFFPGASQRILSASADAVTMEDRVRPLGLPVFTERTTARTEADRVVFHGTNTYATFEGAYAFTAVPGEGTRVRLDAEVRLRGPLRWAEAVARPVILAILRADLHGHAREMATDLARP